MNYKGGKVMKQTISDLLNLDKANIILGRANAMLHFIQLHEDEKQKGLIDNNLIVMPFTTYHHSNYGYHFKGAMAENLNPIIFTQNKEFLDICINTPEDKLGVVSYDFDIVQLSYDEETKIFSTNIISKTEAQAMLQLDPTTEFRDF